MGTLVGEMTIRDLWTCATNYVDMRLRLTHCRAVVFHLRTHLKKAVLEVRINRDGNQRPSSLVGTYRTEDTIPASQLVIADEDDINSENGF